MNKIPFTYIFKISYRVDVFLKTDGLYALAVANLTPGEHRPKIHGTHPFPLLRPTRPCEHHHQQVALNKGTSNHNIPAV